MRALLLVLLTAAETWVGTTATFRLGKAANFYASPIGWRFWQWRMLWRPSGGPFRWAVWWCVLFETVLMAGVGLYAEIPDYWNLIPINIGAALGVWVYIAAKRRKRKLRKAGMATPVDPALP